MTSEAVPFPPRPRELPSELVLSPDSMSMRLTTNEMRMIRQATGKSLGDLESEENTQVAVFSKLRREGFDLTWEQAGDIVVEFRALDPTSGGPSTSSPPSADSGAARRETSTS